MLEKLAHAVLGYDPDFFFLFLSFLQPESGYVKMEPLSRGSLGGERNMGLGRGVWWGRGGGRWATDDRSSLVPLESPPILGYSLSVSLGTGFELFRIHEGRDKRAD